MKFLYCLATILVSLPLCVQAQDYTRPNDLNITEAQAEKYNCDALCQENLQKYEGLDRQIFGNIPFDYDFYATAANFTSSQPGDLLKLQQQNESMYDIPPGTSLWLMQYISVDVGGAPVPVTAFIALPYAEAPRDKVRLVAYAHGTIGFVPACAASSSYNGYDYHSWQLLTAPGYAVVATDHAGLGNNYTSHKYGNPVINSEDVYFSVVAARKAFPEAFTTEWASVGHSQGAGTVWGLSENSRVTTTESGEYLGGVAIAPSARLDDLLTASPIAKGYGFGDFIVNIFKALDFPIQPIVLTPAAMDRYPLTYELGLCDVSASELNVDLPNHGIVDSTPDITQHNHEAYIAFQNKYGAATGRKGYKALLVIQSTDDEIVNVTATVKAYEYACKIGNIVHLSLYSGLNHDSSPAASSPEWLQWLDSRFKGVRSADADKCVVENVPQLLDTLV
ncbi:uncharacterized protein N7482_001552 [Penicillium canariense]|uniref:Serine aminopeptidase S33 domain-containing protein n=1 Tax=Penicillium canariense TaxID=189055 RepID=A0A9W9IGU9_9EURO|nr:uncharacterized protein N7482_001552 [Penicillium canariense]KAJ5175675.1 hypothetical protein N7482_001552 [Penicillium canariense]